MCNGKQFVEELVTRYGLLEGYRMAVDYLEMQKDVLDKKEIEFCNQIKIALWKLDQI